MKKYYPEGTKVFINSRDTQYAGNFVNMGSFLISNKPPDPKQFVFHCPVADFQPHPDAVVIEDLVMAAADYPLSGVHNGRMALKEAMAMGNGTMIGEARVMVDRAERALREYWEKVATDDTRNPEPILEARVESALAAAAVDIAVSDIRQTLAADNQK